MESIPPPILENINIEDGLEFMNIVNSSSKALNDGRFLSAERITKIRPSQQDVYTRYLWIIKLSNIIK